MNKAKVYLVGAGPGKPDLITLRGLNVLKEADVIVYDYLVSNSLLEYTKKEAELVSCDSLSMNPDIRQEKINEFLVKKAKEGKRVIRLKGGDPNVFGRSSEEMEALFREKIDFEIVPGITAAIAASSFAGIPITDRRFASSCAFVAGQEDPSKTESLIDWDGLAKSGTVVLYMAVGNLDNIVKRMLDAGKDKSTAVAVVQDVSLPTQKILTGTLNDIAMKSTEHGVTPPAVIIIGEVTKLEKQFNWLKRNKRVLFTGLSGERFFLEGTYTHVPLIKIEPMGDYKEFDEHLKHISNFDWIVFTSRYGVEHFFIRLKAAGYDARKIANIKIAAIGKSTANRLLDHTILADLVPLNESSEGLVEEFKKHDLNGKNMFLPRSDISDKGLEMALEELGTRITASFAYKNVMPEDLPDLCLDEFDEIMFTSPSTVRNFKKRYGEAPEGVKINCIGEVTLKEAKKCGLLD